MTLLTHLNVLTKILFCILLLSICYSKKKISKVLCWWHWWILASTLSLAGHPWARQPSALDAWGVVLAECETKWPLKHILWFYYFIRKLCIFRKLDYTIVTLSLNYLCTQWSLRIIKMEQLRWSWLSHYLYHWYGRRGRNRIGTQCVYILDSVYGSTGE